jgi:predicted nucleic acid-binding protein
VIAPDTSVVIAALATWHEAHEPARKALAASDRQLIAHVAFETTSALSRMPEGSRISPGIVLEALERAFPDRWLQLDAAAAREVLTRAVSAGIRGGALYDALIGATADQYGARLLTADRRARMTYESMGVAVDYLGD